ncbi:MAG: phytanoyl-CoA dioxygenase family protein [Wenzhouxiangellaceae bacterium]|nr:phytanoyl-CoA dioxygenase family protein [Wenzhouxiangellaceae bacterium]
MTRADERALSDADRAHFRDRGYLVRRGACDAARVARMRAVAEAALRDAVEPIEYEADLGYPGAPRGREAAGGRTARRLLGALDRDPVFMDWARAAPLVGPVRRLLDTQDIRVVRAHHNCVMTKQPRFSSLTGWHRDTRYWAFDRDELVNAWTALGTESEDNGGMRLIPGSHREAFPPEAFDSRSFFRDDLEDNRRRIAAAEQVDLGPGDVLLFDARLLHAAGRNRTEQRKLSVVFTYRAADNPPQPGTRSAAVADLDPERPG